MGVGSDLFNGVMPGVTKTEMNAKLLTSPDACAGAEALSVFSRNGRADDIADGIAFLVSMMRAGQKDRSSTLQLAPGSDR